MRVKMFSKLKLKIRYIKEGDHYCLTVNKRFLDEFYISYFLKVKQNLWEGMLLEAFKATKEKARCDSYPKYTFKTLRDAKKAVEWLRSIAILNKIIE